MTTVDFARVRRLVEAAHELSEDERALFLERACGDDSALRAEVDELLCSADESSDFLEPHGDALDVRRWMPAELELTAGMSIGGFRLVQRVASGGMGTIWEAEQADPRRKVAFKTLRFGVGSHELVQRFRHEAVILARLRHPHVAQIFAAGVELVSADREMPWYAMEFIEDARTLIEFAREEELSLQDRLHLFVELCDAVQHGHERGVIHRDLKPSNVLIDGDGRLKVIDFGVARMREDGASNLETETGRVLGTLPYMSPEQLTGSSDGIDVRSDVYALGVVLYQLLTFTLPLELAKAPLAEAARIACEVAPSAPSSRVAKLPADLDAITLKTLEKDRDRRYESAQALSLDVQRFLRGEPVLAQPPTVGYQIRTFVRRHRALALASALVVVGLTLATVVSLVFAVRATDAKRTAILARDNSDFREYIANLAAAYAALRGHDSTSARQHLDRCEPLTRGFEWWSLDRRVDRSLWTRACDGTNVVAAFWHPDGSRIFVGLDSGAIELRDPSSGERIADAALAGPLASLALDPTGRFLVAAAGTQLVLLDAGSLEVVRSWTADERSAKCAAFTPTGQSIVSCGMRGDVVEWDASTGLRLRELERNRVAGACLAISPDLRWLAIGTTVPSEVVVWDFAPGTIASRLVGHTGYVSCVSFDRTSSMLASSSHDHTIRIWDPASGELVRVLRGHDDIVTRAIFDPSGERIASSGWDRTIRLWDASDGRELAILFGSADNVGPIGFSGDGERLIAGDSSSHVKLWNLAASNSDVAQVHGKWLWKLRFWPDGESVLAVHGGFADRFATASDRVLASYPYHGAEWRGAAVSPDGESVALGDASGRLSILRADGTNALSVATTEKQGLIALDWGVKSSRLVGGSESGAVYAFEGAERTPRKLADAGARVRALALDPAGERIAFVGARGELCVIDAESGISAWTSSPSFTSAFDLAWSPDAERVAVAAEDGRVLLWNVAKRSLERELVGHTGSALAVAFSPDGARLASGSLDRSIRLWEPRTGREILVATDHAYRVEAVAFSPDGAMLASGSSDSTLRWWSAGQPGERLAKEILRTARLARDVRGAIESAPDLDERARIAAFAFASKAVDDPREFAREAWIAASAPASEPAILHEALARARVARDYLPDDPFTLQSLAAVDVRLGESSTALAEFERGPALAHDEWIARAIRAIALARTDRCDEARRELDEIESDWSRSARPYRPMLHPLVAEARAAIAAR